MKKVLSLVLVLALVLGSFSMAFAAETKTTNMSDVAGNANEGAIVVANDLGIVTGYNDGTFKPANAVTRAEFAAMMTRALAIPESALKGFKTSSFKDVASDHWAVAYLGYCNSKGIMTGYEDGTARPNQTITVNEAMTMICRALGYTAQAKELVGAWPANYIALGQQLSLYDDVAATATTDRASAAQIIYNALTVPVKYIDADGVTRPLTDGNGDAVTMLGSLGGNKVNGGNGFVLTSDQAEAAVINVNEYVGQFVSAFCNNDNEIIAVEVLSTTVSGDYDNGTFSTDDVDYYFDGANNYDYTAIAANGGKTANTTPAFIVNGKVSGNPLPALGNGMTLAVKLNGKTITEVYSVFDWDVAAMDKFEASDLNIEKAKINVNGTDYKFKTDKNGDIDATSFALVGVTSLDKIAEDNVIEVYVSGGFITKIAVGTKTVKGTIDEISKNLKKYTLEGTKYALTANYGGIGNGFGDTPTLGDAGTAYLNYDGDIAYWDIDDSTAGNYAIFLSAGNDSDVAGMSSTSVVALMLKDGTAKTYNMSSDCNVAAGLTEGKNSASGSIVTYSFDDKGNVDTDVVATATQSSVTGAVNAGYTAFAGKEFASNVVVFIYDGSKTSFWDRWSIGTVKDLKTKDGTTNNFTATIVQNPRNGKIEAIAVDKTTAIGSNDSYGLINSQIGKMDGSDKKWYVSGVIDGQAKSTFTNKSYNTSIDWVSLTPDDGSVGLYKITTDASGVVTGVTVHGLTGVEKIVENATVTAVASDGITLTTTASVEFRADTTSDVIVYYYDADDGYVVSKLSNIGKGKKVSVFSTTTDNQNSGLYNIVVFWDAE